MKKTAIVLAGGTGKRMNSSIPKQYMSLKGKPVLFYSLAAFEKSSIDEIVLVCGESDISICKNQIVEAYGFHKVKKIVIGGKERYDSVVNGLHAMEQPEQDDVVLIHDGARPCLTQGVIERCLEDVSKFHACVAAVPVKDTIKVANQEGFAIHTPDRNTLWQIQTPQVFDAKLIINAYHSMMADCNRGSITDDAMVVEKYTDIPVKLTMGGYNNIKITTPEDINLAEELLQMQ